MAMDLKWLLSADDKASPVFDKVQSAGKQAAEGINGAFSPLLNKFNLVTGAVGALTAVAGGLAFNTIIKQAVDWDISVGKLASTLGMTAEEASIYKVAMHSVGVEQDVAEKAGLKLAKTLDTNESAFKKLGVTTRDSSGHLRSTADLMPEVNEKLSKMAAGTDRNVVAMEIYGRSWGDVKQLLKVNTGVMEEARQTAERLHLIIGDEGVEKAKEYKKNMNELGLVGKSVGIQLGNELLPRIVAVGSYLSENAPVIGEYFGKFLDFGSKVIQTVGGELAIMAYRFVSFGGIVKDVATGDFSAARQEWNNMTSAGENWQQKITKIWTDVEKVKTSSKGSTGKQMEDDLASTKDALASVSTEVDKYAKSIQTLGKDELEVAKNGFSNDLKTQQALLKENTLQFNQMSQPLKNYLNVINQVYGEQLDKQRSILGTLTSIGATQKTIAQQNVTIATTERTQLTTSLTAWQSYLTNLETMYKSTYATMKKEQTDLYNSQKTTNALVLGLQQQLMTPTEKYYSTINNLEQQAKDATKLTSDEKIKALESVQKSWAGMTSEVKDGDAVIISQTDAVTTAIDKVRSLGDQISAARSEQINTTQSELEALKNAMGDAASMIDSYKTKIHDLDGTIAALTRSFDLTMTDKATPIIEQVKSEINSLRNANITISASYVPVYTTGIAASDGYNVPSYDVGTPYVPRTGPAIIHQGERIVTAKDNASGNYGGMNLNLNGGINVVVQGGSNGGETADEIARQVWPKIQELAKRQKAA